jgi:hypothetical protein
VDVDEHQVGLRFKDELDQLGAIAGATDYLKAGPLEKARQPLAEQYIVIGNNYPPSPQRRGVEPAALGVLAIWSHHQQLSNVGKQC